MPTILFDDEIFSIQTEGGISRYFTELLGCLAAMPDVRARLPFRLTCNRHLAASPHFNGRLLGGGKPIPWRRTLARAINRRATQSALSSGQYDVVHATLYDEGLLDLLGAARLVITVHDMVQELMPDAVGGVGPEFLRAKHALITQATGVVAVSANTADDLARITGRPRDTIRVIHHGVSNRMQWRPDAGASPPLPDRFILFVGNRRAYKNFAGIASALAQLLRAHPDLVILCFGGGPFTPEERGPFVDAGVVGRLVAVRGNDRMLAAAYAHAVAFVYPSLYEGFGMPILEAMINRCPVVISARSCFPEIAGDAALYVDMAEPACVIENLTRLLRDGAMRRDLGEAGARRAAGFTWSRSAAEHADLYRSLAA